MPSSLAEQLRHLAAPQTSILTDKKKRASILFDPKEAANKDRKTIFDLGYSGLLELIAINPIFSQFEQTLFDKSTIKLERSVESTNVNKLIDKNIRRFFYHLSPFFMLQPAHLCIEWLIRRYHIHEFNKSELIGLILPYHDTKIFVKCVQLLDLTNPNDPWKWLEPVQKPGVPLSKTTLLNRAASDSKFLKFVCDTTKNMIKEVGQKGHTLQSQINFYYVTVIGSLEHSHQLVEAHVLNILPSILNGLASKVIDFTSASLMITVQLCSKTKLSEKLLIALIGKICEIDYPSMQLDVILSLIIIFQRQSETLQDFPDEHLVKFITKKWVTLMLHTLSVEESVSISSICNPLVGACLKSIQ